MKRLSSIALVLVLAAPVVLLADEDPNPHSRRQPGAALHYLITTDHVLTPGELDAAGVEVQHVLPGNRYLVRSSDAGALAGARGIRNVELYAAREKMSRAALRAAANTSPFVTVNVLFHDDATYAAASAAVEAAGGTIDTPLAFAVDHPQRLRVRIPPGAIAALARSEAVFGVYGPPMRPVPINDTAATLSHVTPVYSAPYNLDGSGVVLSQFEPDNCTSTPCSSVDATHPEFGGRVTLHNSTQNSSHATHVAGTMIAKGINARAKGMAPNAALNEYDVSDLTQVLTDKGALGGIGVTADNNSWGLVFGWQPPTSASGLWIWNGNFDYFGAYDSFISAPYDKIARDPNVNVLFVHSAGNDGFNGQPDLDTNARHYHTDINGSTVTSEIWCYSKNGSGTDCPSPQCSAGLSKKGTDDNGNVNVPMCESVKHPTYTAYGTMSLMAAEKNVLAIGACDSVGTIAFFGSRGPAADGRVKPDLMALGVDQYSTVPNSGYATMSGTSMSSPVVTGISALVAQQWKQTFNARPSAQQIKTLLIAGARDQVGDPTIDLPGPDYAYGFGLVDAQASVDLIRADAGTGSHILTANVANGQSVEIPLAITTGGKFRAVLAWADPEVLLPPATDTTDPLATKTLVNDLDLKIVDAGGNTTLPYVLDKDHPTVAATRGVNSVDNTEVVEIANATQGSSFKAVITGKSVPVSAPQTYVFVTTTATQSAPAAPCSNDAFEPNDTAATATAIADNQTVTAKLCANDTDNFGFFTNRSGSVSVTVTTKDTAVTVQLTPGSTTTVAANSSATLTGTAGSGAQAWLVKVTPTGSVTGDNSYTIKATFPLAVVGRVPGRRGH